VGGEEKGKNKKDDMETVKNREETEALASATPPFPMCYGTVEVGALSTSARLDVLPSAGTSLLDYERDVPVARPQRR
jgi:hypothetical protein